MPKVRALTAEGRTKQLNEKLNSQIIDGLQQARHGKKITFDNLAARTGISVPTLCRYFKRPEMMTIQTYRTLYRALGMEVKL